MKIDLKNIYFNILLVITISTVAFSIKVSKDADAYIEGDGRTYISVAQDIYETGYFTNGNFSNEARSQTPHNEGMFFAPAYPYILSLFLKYDTAFRESVLCQMAIHPAKVEASDCGKNYGLFVPLQTAAIILSSLFIWLSAYVMFNRKLAIPWLALIISFAVKDFGYYASNFYVESFAQFFYCGAAFFGLMLWKDKKLLFAVLSGLFWGVGALVKPTYVYGFYFFFIISAPILFFSAQNKIKTTKATGLLVLIALSYLAATSFWMHRNYQLADKFTISDGYGSFILAQRVSYNDMRPKEYAASFVFWLPDFGDSLAYDLFKKEDVERLAFETPHGFYQRGQDEVMNETLEKAGGYANHLSYLLHEEVFGNITKHTLVTLPLVWRGMFISKYWGLVAIILFIVALVALTRRKQYDFFLYALPIWFMVGLNGFVSVSISRYNLGLIAILSIGAAWCIYTLYETRIKRKRTQI
jgi:hypothetical protein